MFGPNEPITKEGFMSFVKGMPNALIVSLYCISKYHEKYRFTEWCMIELSNRGFTKKDMGDFDSQFENFYDQMLKQENL